MRLRIEYERYESKLATIVSLLQGSGIIGWSLFFIVCAIPAFICLACGVKGAFVGALFGVAGVLSIVLFILFIIFVQPEKINERYWKKLSKKYKPSPAPPTPDVSRQSDEERLQKIKLRSYIGSLSDEEFSKIDIRKENGKYIISKKTDSGSENR